MANSSFEINGSIIASSGSFIVGSGSAGSPSFEFSGDTDTGMFSPAINTIALATSGVERLRVDSIGNVGIGTATPAYQLDVSGIANIGNNLRINSQVASTIAGFDGSKNVISLSTETYPSLTELSYVKGLTSAIQTQINSKQNTLTNPVTGVGTSGYLTKWISSSGVGSGVIFDNGTNIGIGTSSPSGKLDINGTLYVGTTGVANNFYIRTGQAGISETALKLRSDTSSNLYLDASNAYVKVGNQSADVDIAAGNAGIRIGNNSAQTLANQNIRFVPANTEIMRITPTGIGIGTTTPIAPLHIANSLTGSAANSGVLINTTHLPNSNGQSISSLNVSPTFSNIYSNISNTYALLISPVSSGQFTTTNSYGLYVNAANILNGSVTNNYAAVFMNGNVGIGTASPSARLEVAASATTSVDIAHFSNSNGMEKAKFSLSSNGDGTLSLMDGNNVTNAFLSSSSTSSSYVNGKFGIGTSTPSSQLHVSGLIQGNAVGTTGTIISNSHASQTANGQDHTSLYINPTFLTSSSNLGNTYGLLISPSHSGTYATTNSYGLYVNASTLVSGTLYNNYAATFMGGNVGIGTSSPSYKLDTVGDTRTSGNFYCYGAVSTTGYISFTSNYSANNTVASIDCIRGANWGGTLLTHVKRSNGGYGGQYGTVMTLYDDPTGYPNQNTHFSLNTISTSANQNAILYIGSGNNTSNTRNSIYTENGGVLAATTGNIGIGVASPAEKLEINGFLKFANCTTKIGRFDANNVSFATSSSALGHYGILIDNTATANGKKFRLASWADGTTAKFIVRDDSAGVDRFTIDTAGNVGIGTSSPSARLHATIADGNSVLLLNRSTTLAGISLDFTGDFSNLRSYYGLKIFTGSTTANAGTERVHFTDTGLVGVGTSTPSGQLHVIGTGLFSNSIGINTNTTSVGATPYALLVDGDVSIGSGNAGRTLNVWSNNSTKRTVIKNVNGTSFLTYSIGSQNLNIGGPQPNDTPFNTINYYAGNPTPSTASHRFHVSVDGTGIAPIAVITNSGLGIGTTTPSGQLDVAGDVYVRGTGNNLGTIYFKSQAVGDKALYIGATNGGDIVINGNGPNAQFSSQGGYVNLLGSSTQMHIGHSYDAGNTSQIIRFLPAAREMMRMTTSGTLGIGLPTSASSYAGNSVQLFNQQPYANTRVHIAGSGADSGSAALIVTNSGISPLLYVRNDGNIGIGTTTPSSQLHVIGSGIFSSGLFVGSTPVSVSGHSHTSSDITNFNSSVSGLINGIYAPLNSPALIGVPTVPTASSGTNTTQIASTAFVRTEISNLVASAPSTLDTLNELATALGNDANFATTVTNNLAGKANLSGATFTGSISGPSGNFVSLKSNGIDVSLSGHNHSGVYADIATGDPTIITNSIVDNAYAIYDPVNSWPGLWIADSSVYSSDPSVFDSFKINMGLTDAVIGTGVANHIAYWNNTSGIVADSGQLYWDSTNNMLGIGTASPSVELDVQGGNGAINCNYLIANTLLTLSDYNSSTNGSLGIGDYTSLYHINWNINQNGNATFNGVNSDSIQGANDSIISVQNLTISSITPGTLSIDSGGDNLSIGGDGTVNIASAVDNQINLIGNVDIQGNLVFDSFTESVVANGNSGTSKTLSLASGTVHTCTLTGNCTFTMPTTTAGKSFNMFLNTGSGNYTASFSGVRWADSATPTATILANKVDIYSFTSDGSYWYGSFSQNYG